MSNSPLVTYTNLSPNHSWGRWGKITRITPHYVAGNATIEALGELFANPARRASSNYGIGSDGRVGMYVEEHNRPWTSGSAYNDNKAVTIECANLADGSLTEACWDSLVLLCADICRRNEIPRLVYTGDDSGNLTMHKWYDNTDCPGPWLSQMFGKLADEVNELLGRTEKEIEEMTFLFTCDGKDFSGKVFFYDGGFCKHVSAAEKKAIETAYKNANGKNIPFFHQPDGREIVQMCARK